MRDGGSRGFWENAKQGARWRVAKDSTVAAGELTAAPLYQLHAV